MEATIRILTARHGRACITSGSTLIDIHTYNTVPRVAGHASTCMGTIGVAADSVLVALVLARRALIHIATHNTIPVVARLAVALVTAVSICTLSIGTALVLASRTLVDIPTIHTITRKPWLTRALEGAFSILTHSMIITVVGVCTCALIVISAREAIAAIASSTFTSIGSLEVYARRVGITLVSATLALVHIRAERAIPDVARIALASVAAMRVCAAGVR